MQWTFYSAWQRNDPQNRPVISLADGYLAGAVVSLQTKSDDLWIADILGSAGNSRDDRTAEFEGLSKAKEDLRRRLSEAREQLALSQTPYAPVLDISPEGDFDVTAWAVRRQRQWHRFEVVM